MAFFSTPLTAVLKWTLFNTTKNSQHIHLSVRSTQLAGDPLAKKKNLKPPKPRSRQAGTKIPGKGMRGKRKKWVRFSFCSSWGLSPAGCKQSLLQANDFLRHPGKVFCVHSAKFSLPSTISKTENRQSHTFRWSLSLLPQVQLAAFLNRTELCNKSSPLLSKIWTGSWRVTVSEGACKHLYLTAGNLTCPAELPARVSRGAVYLDKRCCSHCKADSRIALVLKRVYDCDDSLWLVGFFPLHISVFTSDTVVCVAFCSSSCSFLTQPRTWSATKSCPVALRSHYTPSSPALPCFIIEKLWLREILQVVTRRSRDLSVK